MDKALEVIMVAVILVVASVVIMAMLQSQTGGFSDFSKNRTDSSSCGLLKLKYKRNVCESGSEGTTGSNIESKADDANCDWSDGSTDVTAADVC